MFRRVKVFSRVFILGGVAAPHMPARETQPQVHPCIPHFETLLAALLIGVFYSNLIEMHAPFRHFTSPDARDPNGPGWLRRRKCSPGIRTSSSPESRPGAHRRT